jgi:hypothetical protein
MSEKVEEGSLNAEVSKSGEQALAVNKCNDTILWSCLLIIPFSIASISLKILTGKP